MDKVADLIHTEITDLERAARHVRCMKVFALTSLWPRSLLITLFDALGEWHERMCQRRQLMKLDARALADIGISRADAEAEYEKMPWRQ